MLPSVISTKTVGPIPRSPNTPAAANGTRVIPTRSCAPTVSRLCQPPPHLQLNQPQRRLRLPLVTTPSLQNPPLRLKSHRLPMRLMSQTRFPARSPHSLSKNRHHSKIPPLRTPTLPLRSFLLSKRHRSTLPKSTSKN